MDTAQPLEAFLDKGGLGEKVTGYREQDFTRLQKQFPVYYNEASNQGGSE